MTAHSELLRMKLDPTETMEILGASFEEYESLCDAGYLDSEDLGRGFFDPIVKFHSFWNVVECKLAKKLELKATEKREYLADLLDEIAELIEYQEALDPGYVYDLTSIFSAWSLRKKSVESPMSRADITGSALAKYAQHHFVTAHAKMLAFCRERILHSMYCPFDFLDSSPVDLGSISFENSTAMLSDQYQVAELT